MCFTDESHFEFSRTKVRQWCKKRPVKYVPLPKITITIWGGISMAGATPLFVTKKTINSEDFCEILNECLFETMNTFYSSDWILQMDNAPIHT